MPGKSVKHVANAFCFRTCLNVAFAEFDPERRFIGKLCDKDNAEKLDAWIKSTDALVAQPGQRLPLAVPQHLRLELVDGAAAVHLIDLARAATVVRIDLAQNAVHEGPEAVPALRGAGVEMAQMVDRGDDLAADRERRALVRQQPAQVTPDRLALVDQVRVSLLPLGNGGDLGHVVLLPPGSRPGSSYLPRHPDHSMSSHSGRWRQAGKAQHALDQAFSPEPPDEQRVLFTIPVTKALLRQIVLGLVLICHSSFRGVVEFLRDLFDFPLSLGTVANIVHAAVAPARASNDAQTLSAVEVGAHDEIYQTREPVLVGVCAHSGYCYLLSQEQHRDAATWQQRLQDLTERGFAPSATIGDFAGGLRAGQKLALPEVPCRGDVFHAL